MNKHLSIDELVDRLYGIGASGHLDACADCRQRFDRLRARRAGASELAPASHEFLAAQRRNIYARMGERPRTRMGWVPALAAALCLVTAGVFAHRPAPPVAVPEIDNTKLFSDVYSMEQSMEPLAAKPIHAIFEQDQ